MTAKPDLLTLDQQRILARLYERFVTAEALVSQSPRMGYTRLERHLEGNQCNLVG